MSLEKNIKLLFMMNTPADVHTWKYVIRALTDKGHEVRILARDYGGTLQLLDKYGFKFRSFNAIRSKYLKIFEIVRHCWQGWKLCKQFNPDVITGFGVDVALTGALCRKPSIVFTDTEPIPVQHFLTRLFAQAILTPSCFLKDLGRKQLRFPGYKELAYLHPNYFRPDPSICDELGISTTEKYVVLRFNTLDAFHDIGKYGFSLPDKYGLVRDLEKYCRVFISAEGSLPKDLESYRLATAFHTIHHVLHYARLFVSDTGTMITEAAVLGTPSIFCGSSPERFGNFVELEHKYNLIYCFSEPKQAIEKALQLIQQPDCKDHWARGRQILLADKMDTTKFMVDFIEAFIG